MYAGRPGLQTRTKIVATLGPASWDEPMLTNLLQAGVDVCRINCSHADHESIRRQVSRVRRAAMKLAQPVGILLDLQGPKIRTSKVRRLISWLSRSSRLVDLRCLWWARGNR